MASRNCPRSWKRKMAFNNSQIQAIHHKDGPAMVLAGPGSGKTTVITNRTKYLIETHHIHPSHILVITFTKAAAKEMQERFARLMGTGAGGVTFGTFHSVFFRILKYAYHYSASSIADEETRRGFVKDIVQQMNLETEDGSEFAEAVLSEISMIKNDQLDLERYYAKSCSEEMFRKLYQKYEDRMRRENLIDFDDMLLMTYELLAARPDILDMWRKQYRYILIDEFQDINRVQYQVVRLLAAPSNNLFIVGDDDQSIYRFRGARPEIMLGFPKDYPNVKTIQLDINYRSTATIVKAASRLIGHNRVRFPKEIKAERPPGCAVSIQHCLNVYEESEAVLDWAETYRKRGIPLEQMAVLFRTGAAARPLVERLMEYRIPFQMRDVIPNLYEHWVAKDMATYLRIAGNDRSRALFLRIINRPNRYIHREALDTLQVDLGRVRQYYSGKDWMEERIDRLEYDIRMLGLMAPYPAIHYIRNGMQYDQYIREYAQSRKVKEEDLLELLDALQESAKPFATSEEWFAHMEAYTQELKEKAKQRAQRREGITLSTMHSAKGLEYEAVFVIDVNEGVTPHHKSVLEADLEEERRLFYVAATRAKTYLHLLYMKERYHKEMFPSRFLAEMEKEG